MSEPAAGTDLLSRAAPAVGEAEARRAARELYGLDVAAGALAGERDANFLLTAAGRPRWMLKFINPAENPAESDFQDALLRHAVRRDPDLPVPRLVSGPLGDGGLFYTLDGAQLRIRLVTWLGGTPLHQVTTSHRLLTSLGRGLARLDLALADFSHPASRRTLLWNASDPGRARPYLARLADPAQRRMLAALLDHFDEHMLSRLAAVRHQVIHNDFNPHNVLVDTGTSTLGGIIDFGDALYAPLINELATALAYQVHDGEDVLASMPPFVAGYHQLLPLSDDEIRLLPALITARMALSVILTQWRAERYPTNRAYILRHMSRAWSGLQRLSLLGHDRMADRLGSALSQGKQDAYE